MKKIISTLVITAVAMIGALPAMAQQPRAASSGGNSPHETISAVIDGNRVTITYGRPYTIKPGTTEARKIWGGLVPYDKPWRMGADEATTPHHAKADRAGRDDRSRGRLHPLHGAERSRHFQTGHQHQPWRLGNSRGHEA